MNLNITACVDGALIVRPSGDIEQAKRLIVEAPAMADALRWALEQIEDSLDPDHQAALADAWSLVEGIE